MALENAKKPFSIVDKLGYMFGDFGNDFTFLLASSFMLKFYTDVMGIDAAVVGVVMMLARFVDAFTDIGMGSILDRSTPTKAGKFRPWILRMCVPVAIASFLIYQSGFAGMPYAFKVGWCAVTYILWGSFCYTAINIPYGSMASAISADPTDRANLSTFRSVGGNLAGMVLGVIAPIFAYVTVDGKSVMSGSNMTILAGIFSICAIVCYLLCYKMCTERVEVPKNEKKLNIIQMLKDLVTNRSLLGIVIAAIALLLGMLGLQGLTPFVYADFYNNGQIQSLSAMITTLAPMFICAPLAPKMAKKFGKKELSIACCLFSAVMLIIIMLIKPTDPIVFIILSAITFLGFGFFNMLIWAMITDVIDDAEVIHGVREDGTIYGCYSFARKIGQALSSGLVGAILGVIGYTAGTREVAVLDGIFNWSCLIPAIGLVVVALALAFIYPLNKKRVESNEHELARRRGEIA